MGTKGVNQTMYGAYGKGWTSSACVSDLKYRDYNFLKNKGRRDKEAQRKSNAVGMVVLLSQPFQWLENWIEGITKMPLGMADID